jgi:hypothetical protein
VALLLSLLSLAAVQRVSMSQPPGMIVTEESWRPNVSTGMKAILHQTCLMSLQMELFGKLNGQGLAGRLMISICGGDSRTRRCLHQPCRYHHSLLL